MATVIEHRVANLEELVEANQNVTNETLRYLARRVGNTPRVFVDSELSASSENPVQNKVLGRLFTFR